MQLDEYLPSVVACAVTEPFERPFTREIYLRESEADRFSVQLHGHQICVIDFYNGANNMWFVYLSNGAFAIRTVRVEGLRTRYDCRPLVLDTLFDNLDAVETPIIPDLIERLKFTAELI